LDLKRPLPCGQASKPQSTRHKIALYSGHADCYEYLKLEKEFGPPKVASSSFAIITKDFVALILGLVN
jgi:hypothetical protein